MTRTERRIAEIMDGALLQVSAIGEQVKEAEEQGRTIDYKGTLEAAVKWTDDALDEIAKIKEKK